MCGINGFNFSDKSLILKMNQSIAHRGPDAEGFFTNDNVSVGHRRLSIIDLSEMGKQPMFYKEFVITYNGEIYNFSELKNELKLQNHQFQSESDTEVILHAYEEWGFECVKKFNGMWAFCIYDKLKNIFFISRDRFGVKPLYYYFYDKKFIFSSELKAIRQHDLKLDINKIALNYYFYQKYITGEHTIFKQVFKLKPSHSLIFNLETREIKLEKYFKLDEEIEQQKLHSLKDRLGRIEDLIVDAVDKRLISDVPVGSFLSGGIDSSLISAIIARKKKDFDTFSIGFKEKTFNELPYSIKVADYIKTNHHYKILDLNSEIVKSIFSDLDEPFGDASILPTFLLSKMTREKVTVSLSGDAGDEVFGGYDTYKAYKMAKFFPSFIMKLGKSLVKKLPASDKYTPLKLKITKFFKDYHPNRIIRHLNWMSQTDEIQRIKLLKDNYIDIENLIEVPQKANLLDIQLNDIQNYLAEDILKKVDTASMMVSLEARVPFLDYRLVSIILSLPEKYKVNLFTIKYYLKKIAHKYLPSEIIKRKKHGFSIPLSRWIKESELIKVYLIDNKYYMHNLIDKIYVEGLYRKHLANESDYSRLLWLVFVFNFWYDKTEVSKTSNFE